MNDMQLNSKAGIAGIGNKYISLDIFSRSGDIFELNSGEVGITLSSGNKLDSYSGIDFYLDSGYNNRISLMESRELFGFGSDSAYWKGNIKTIQYKISFRPSPETAGWFWIIELSNEGAESFCTDLTYYMDKGLAPRATLKTNEYYNSHYLDCTVLEDQTTGFVVATRQNLDVHKGYNPWLLEGCSFKAESYATDGEDFFGKQYRSTRIAGALSQSKLPSRIRQGQYAISALQTGRITIEPNETKEIVFWGRFLENHPENTKTADLAYGRECLESFKRMAKPQEMRLIPDSSSKNLFPKMISGEPLNEDDLNQVFGKTRTFCETGSDGKLWSFFQNEKHIILIEKDRHMPVPTGHILRTGQQLFPDDHILSMSCYMNGCFASQMAIGNSYFNSFLSHPRSLHDLSLTNGLRIAVDDGAGFRLLSQPSAFALSMNYAEWIYKLGNVRVHIKAEVEENNPTVNFSIECSDDSPLRFKLFFFPKYSEDNRALLPLIDTTENREATIEPHPDSLFFQNFPGIKIRIKDTSDSGNRTASITDGYKYRRGHDDSVPLLLAFETEPVDKYRISLSCLFSDIAETVDRSGIGGSVKDFLTLPVASGTNPHLSDFMNKLNTITSWYAGNALIHFSVLYGLEQSKGAAWGVRDVLQGPFEALLSQENWSALREILKLTFTAQYHEDGTWPQWFMLDSYHHIRDKHAHGDVIFWPLKAVCEYLEESADLGFLKILIPYTRRSTMETTDISETLATHLVRLIEAINDVYLVSDSGLLKYGGGDWNDTLQPKDAKIKENLVSVWTMGLAFQYLERLGKLIDPNEYGELSSKIDKLTRKIGESVFEIVRKFHPVPGFLLLEDKIEPFIHPEDGMDCPSYRLLPMIRFINARIFTECQAREHLKIIEDKLWHPDGVKLLDRPVSYDGGKSRAFVRAEQSSFWGREVGLMYVHAHLRFIEALLCLGEADKALKAINQIIPIDLNKTIPNGAARQSNAYFSSSDAGFLNRIEAEKNYDELKEGNVLCYGGWRIYSSGPGIFISLVKRWFFGYRFNSAFTVIDPVIPLSMSGCSLAFKTFGEKKLTMNVISDSGEVCGVKKLVVNGKEIDFSEEPHPYRKGGALVKRETLKSLLTIDENTMDIIL